uniref:Proliferating cell nuclear antigen n=1 Tax=Panagrolaimus sp. JU765 TaxID=591449 RepID=A0AC34RBT1_9BILA
MAYLDEDIVPTNDSFYATKAYAKDMVSVLKCLLGKDKTRNCSMIITNEGIHLVIDEKSSMQWHAYFKRHVFIDFDVRVDTIEIRLPLHDLIEAVNALSPTAKVELRYGSEGSPFTISVEHENTKLDVSIKTFNPLNVLSYEFDDNILAKVSLLPKTIKDVIRDIDSASQTVRFKITEDEFEVSYGNEVMTSTTTFPSYSGEVCEFIVNQELISFHYKSAVIKRLLPALRMTKKVCFRIDERGVLNVQLPIPEQDVGSNFVQVYLLPNLEDYEIL